MPLRHRYLLRHVQVWNGIASDVMSRSLLGRPPSGSISISIGTVSLSLHCQGRRRFPTLLPRSLCRLSGRFTLVPDRFRATVVQPPSRGFPPCDASRTNVAAAAAAAGDVVTVVKVL